MGWIRNYLAGFAYFTMPSILNCNDLVRTPPILQHVHGQSFTSSANVKPYGNLITCYSFASKFYPDYDISVCLMLLLFVFCVCYYFFQSPFSKYSYPFVFFATTGNYYCVVVNATHLVFCKLLYALSESVT